MDFLDHFELNARYLSEEYGLLKPDLTHSVAGVLPELLRRLTVDFQLPDTVPYADHPVLGKQLDEHFPQGYDNLVFLICDAVGAEHLSNMGGPLWENITSRGTIASASFPTMTATVMTSLSYGLHPSTHGVVGYNIYNEHIGQIWNALNLMTCNDDGLEELVTDRVSIDQLVNGTPLMELVELQSEVQTTFLTPEDLITPGLDDLLNPNLDRIDFQSLEVGIARVLQQLSQTDRNQVIALYIPYADHFGHMYGPESEQYKNAIRGIEQTISTLMEHPRMQDGSTVMALTSDHGQSQIDHDISRWMDRNRWQYHRDTGVTLSSSGRVIHAYCDPYDLDKAKALLEKLADGRGLVIDQDTAIDLAGGEVTKQIQSRMGDMLMIMEDGYLYDIPEIVSYGGDDRLHGQHGSLTSKELYVPVGLFGGVKK